MNTKIILAALSALTLALSSCGRIVPVTGNEETFDVGNQGNQSSSDSIGTVSMLHPNVHAGARNGLQLIEGDTQLVNDDVVSVSEGGKARLSFPGPMMVLLYNQSDLDQIRLAFGTNSNPQITGLLVRGGLSGYVEPEHQLTLDLAFGVQVNVLGNSFFVIYDETSGFATIGKFDGTLIVSIPGQNDVNLENRELIDISPDGSVRKLPSIPFAASDFENMADTCSSASQGLNILRRDNGLPLPGKETADPNAQLPCRTFAEPTSSVVTSPALTPSEVATAGTTTACQTGLATVKANNAYLRIGPDVRFSSISQQENGEQVTVLARYKDWFQVQSSDGREGWLYKDWITLDPGLDAANFCTVSESEVPVMPLDVATPDSENCEPSYYDSCN